MGVVQVVYLALELPTYQAAWGWELSVPTDKGFTCKEGTKIGGAKGAKFDCTVTPDSGYSCESPPSRWSAPTHRRTSQTKALKQCCAKTSAMNARQTVLPLRCDDWLRNGESRQNQ